MWNLGGYFQSFVIVFHVSFNSNEMGIITPSHDSWSDWIINFFIFSDTVNF